MHFYATTGDLLSIMSAIEVSTPLYYVRYGSSSTSEVVRFTSARDIPSFGIACSDSAISCAAFLVLPRSVEVVCREIRQSDGIRRHVIDQLHNPTSITFHPGGQRGRDVLLTGRVTTASMSSESRQLLGRFERALKKGFRRVAAFYVGSEAFLLLQRGARLTMSLQSPKTHDLKLA